MLLLLLALALRLINLQERPLWYDEAFAVLFADAGLSAMLYGTLTPVAGGAADIHPLLYYLTLDGWMGVFGQSPFAVRLWSVFLGLLTVAALFTLARRLLGVRVAWAAALLLALAPFHVQYSQETRMYALLGLLAVLTSYALFKAVGYRLPGASDQRPATSPIQKSTEYSVLSTESSPAPDANRVSWTAVFTWTLFGLGAALMMYTQQLAAFYLAALGLIPILARRWRSLGWLVYGVGLAALIYLPWLVQLPGQLAKVGSYYWIEQPTVATFLRTTFSFLVVNLDIPRQTFAWTLAVAVFLVVLLAAFLLLRLVSRGARKLPSRSAGLMVLWMAVMPMLGMWLVSQVRPVYLERALLPSAVMLYLFIGWMLAEEVIPRLFARLLAIPLLALAVVGLYHHYTWATFPNSPFNAAVAQIRAAWQPGDVIVHLNKLSALPMIFYGRDLEQTYLADRPGSPEDTLALPTQESLGLLADGCIQQAAAGAGRIWWVEFERIAAEYAAAGRPDYQQALDWLTTHYTRQDSLLLNDLRITLYVQPRGELSPDCPPSAES